MESSHYATSLCYLGIIARLSLSLMVLFESDLSNVSLKKLLKNQEVLEEIQHRINMYENAATSLKFVCKT